MAASLLFAPDAMESLSFQNRSKSGLEWMDCAKKRTLFPITTGTSVIGMIFDEGVVIAADTLGSYGSLARFRECERIMKVNDNILLGASGDYADFQCIRSVIEEKVIEEENYQDGFTLQPESLYSWLTRVLYNRRSKFDPLWNTFIVSGMQDGRPFLGQIDKIGTAFQAPTLATGFGSYLAQPLMRDFYEEKGMVSKEEAVKKIQECMTVLYYRDSRSFNRYHLGFVTKEGAEISAPLQLETNWEVGKLISGYN